jgi:chorismate mutase-like protein
MKSLQEYRAEIDRLDDAIVRLLVERFEVVKAVGRLKTRAGIAVVQGERVEVVKSRVARLAAEQGLDGDLLRAIYTLIIDHAHIIETEK